MTLVALPVRKAVPEDMPELMDICRSLHSENAPFTMNEDKVADQIKRAFDGRGAIIGAIGPKGKIEGAIYMLISQYWYTDEYCLEELWNHVLPQYRKSNNAKDLISFGKRCSDELGIPLVIGVMSNHRTRAKVGLYTRQLSEPVGAYFLYGKTLKQEAKAV